MLRVLLVSALLVSGAFAEKITILAAASLKFVLEDIKKDFLKTHKKDKIEVSYIASGDAYAQIKEGNKAELFIAADADYPAKVFADGNGASEPKNYVKGKLVLFSINKDFNATSDAILKDAKVQNVAIPNPKVAPYGRAAEAYLKKTKQDKPLKKKLAIGQSIGEATTYVVQGSADVGFTALSMVIKGKVKDENPDLTYAVIDQKYYEPIVQSLVVTKAGENSKLAKEFAEYLLGDKAQAVFANYGYDKP